MSTSFPLDGMRVRFAGATNICRKRDHNEDSISLPETERLAIVADGMGGHASGEVASRLAVELINDHFNETGKQQTLTWPYKVDRDLRTHVNRMVTGIMLANLEIWERSQRESRFKGMGTTCVACHTGLPYALARPALGGDTKRYDAMLESVRKRVENWDQVGPLYPSKADGARGTEAILNAPIRDFLNAVGGGPQVKSRDVV